MTEYPALKYLIEKNPERLYKEEAAELMDLLTKLAAYEEKYGSKCGKSVPTCSGRCDLGIGHKDACHCARHP